MWWWALVVAGCGAVATTHGLYEVARACGVDPHLAWLYVPITDGLALVAYASTARLSGSARGYAWAVVVTAAGLSGLAQAVNLAGLGVPDWRLRFGVGYWPAVAVAVAAHLLWLVGGEHRPALTEWAGGEQADEQPDEHADEHGMSSAHEHPGEQRTPPADGDPRLTLVSSSRRRAPRAAKAVQCDCGCGRRISVSQRTRHRQRAREMTGT